MSWTAFSSTNVTAELSPQEVTGLASAHGSSNLAAIVTNAVAEWREFIRAGGYDLDADTTKVPGGHFARLVAICRWRALISIPALKAMQTEERKTAYDAALKFGEGIAAQQNSVEPPTAPSTTRTGCWNSENKILGRTHPVPRPGEQMDPQTNTTANPDAPEDTGNDA